MSESGKATDDFLREFWRSSVQAPEEVFDALLTDHQARMAKIFDLLSDASIDFLLDSLDTPHMNAQSDWYVEPARKTTQTIQRLSKGFALAANQLAELFGDIYVGKDIKDALLHPDTPSEAYPSTIGNGCKYFLKAVSAYMPEEIWERNFELKTLKISLSLVGDFVPNQQAAEQTTPLAILVEVQKLSRIMPLFAEQLKASGHHNLATIANAFATKAEAMSKDIISRVENAISQKQEIFLGALPERAISAPS